MDLTNGFDFDKVEDQQRAWTIVKRDNPLLIIGSPPCTYFSVLNESNKHLHRNDAIWMQKFDNNLKKAKKACRLLRALVQASSSEPAVLLA